MKPFLISEPVPLSEIVVKEENILRVLLVPKHRVDNFLKDLMSDLIRYCLTICKPIASCTIFGDDEITIQKESATLIGEEFRIQKMVGSAIRKSTSLAVFIGTCGDKVEQYSKKLIAEGNSLEGLITDAIGSEIAENVAEYIHQSVEKAMAPLGLKTTNRYSPGYCNWPVNEQHKLFSVMMNNHSGVTLTASSLMLPIKSVSGLIGIGAHVKNTGYACNYCEMEQCLYRDIKR